MSSACFWPAWMPCITCSRFRWPLLSVFLILVILVQRGRGGGLTGALGGMGGQSAFGTKAGDLFTRITIVVAAIWVLLSMASIKVLAQRTPFDRQPNGLDTAGRADRSRDRTSCLGRPAPPRVRPARDTPAKARRRSATGRHDSPAPPAAHARRPAAARRRQHPPLHPPERLPAGKTPPLSCTA